MALTLFLFKVSNLEISSSKAGGSPDNDDQSVSEMSTTQLLTDENLTLLSAKVIFRGINLWSNNVAIRNGTASFIARGQKPKKFCFDLATALVPEDKVRIEFHTVTLKKKRKKMVGVFELMLESLMHTKYIDLPEENLSDSRNSLLESTVQLKLYYTPPDLEEQNAILDIDNELVDWKSMFDDEGRHRGHRYRHTISKHDSRFKRFRAKVAGRADDADTDSYSDSDFDIREDIEDAGGPMDAAKKRRKHHADLELLEKSLGRYEGNEYDITDWQVTVHVIQGRDFPGLELNPYVSVQIDDQRRYTAIHKCANSPYFGEFFTFDFSLPAIQVMEKVIFLKVHHATKIISKFTDTKPIGIFRLDVSTVYNEIGHIFERKWAQLINPESVETSCGHLLVSISVTERGVSQKNVFTEEIQDNDEFKPSKTLIPLAMPRPLFPVEIKITLFSAMELPGMMTDFLASVSKRILQSESWEPVDPYVEVSYNTLHATTSHRNGTTPVWGEAIHVLGRFPPLIRTIKISLKDHAAVQQDRVISSFLIDLFLISESNPAAGFLPTLGPTWMFLYGSPREYTMSKEQDGLSKGMGEAVCYKGRLLMEIECHPVSGDNNSSMQIQKESGIEFPAAFIFPVKRTFLLFGCIYDVTMIDESFGNSTICFELSIGPSGYLNPEQLVNAIIKPVSSLTRPYPRLPLENNRKHFRLPIDLQKPIIFTKHTFHDYIYRMTLSNRFKHAADHLHKQIREFESKVKSKASNEDLMNEYGKIENYIHSLPCGCIAQHADEKNLHSTSTVHPNLYEILNATQSKIKMNQLDIKRRKKLSVNLESLKEWSSKEMDFDESKRYEIVKDLYKIARIFRQMALDAQPALPDVFLWMICDSKRVAYARISPEDLLFNACRGDKGSKSGSVQTIFLKQPRSADKPLRSSTNAKVEIFLWLGIEDYEPYLFKQLPAGFEMPQLPLHPDEKFIRYTNKTTYEVRCHCYKARALIASDETGLSDPYLSITVGNETQTTLVLRQSLCPQWNTTLRFQNLTHVGTRETAEQIIGNVVVECYDYDDTSDGPELIGRFATTAKLNIMDAINSKKAPLEWYELKFGDKRAGEVLAIFELLEINPETREVESAFELEEIPPTKENFPPESYVLKHLKNKTYRIPHVFTPNMKNYEIEIMFWGLREFRKINLQAIEEADVTIECAGARITRKIKDAQKNPNFLTAVDKADRYKLSIKLPDDENFWPHLSILCVQNRLFGMKEIVGNLVVTNLQKYLNHPAPPPTTSEDLEVADKVNELARIMPYKFNRIRKSVVDAYEAALTEKDKDLGNQKLVRFETEAGGNKDQDGSQIAIINSDSLAKEANAGDDHGKNEKSDDQKGTTDSSLTDDVDDENRPLTTAERLKRNEMEKTATWWNKYYASKAKMKLAQRALLELDEDIVNSFNAYSDFFEDESRKRFRQLKWWQTTKKIFARVGKAPKNIRRIAKGNSDESDRPKSAVDESLDFIETDRLKELTLMQTFEVIETELENVQDYEGFNDCLDKFPLYKGKGSSRSDEQSDENRVYVKFKGKIRIRELTEDELTQNDAKARVDQAMGLAASCVSLTPRVTAVSRSAGGATIQPHQQMLQFDYNKNPIALKCRLYIIKATLYRGWDQLGKADPFLKIVLNNETIINDVKGKLQNTLEPVFGKSFEFEVKLPIQTLLRIQLWDWDMTSSNDMIAETKIDVENRWFSCHRATCGLAKRYDSTGYNVWRDTKKPTIILNELCRTNDMDLPEYSTDLTSLTIGKFVFNCDPECVEYMLKAKPTDVLHRKVQHESPQEYIRQNTALAALHGWGKKISTQSALVAEHIECRSLYNPDFPETEQGKLEMWLDFYPMTRPPTSSMIDITPPKPRPYELRVTIWNTADVELDDENFLTGEKSSDIYVKAWILGEKTDCQQTDIHYRSLTGEGNFNWRFVFNFDYLDIEEKIVFEAKDSVFQVGSTVKKIPPRILIRVYDADLISGDDFLGECILNLTHFPIGAKQSKKCKASIVLNSKQPSVNLFNVRRAAGWWPMIAPSKDDEIRDKALLGGKLEAEFSLLSAEEALVNPVGKAREAPQPLDEPNRPKTSFLWFMSPWRTFRYIIWRNFKWPIIIGIILLILTIFLLLVLWSLPGEIVRQASNKIFKTSGTR